MKKVLMVLAAIVAMATLAVPSASATGTRCSVVWGSLAKSSSATGSGQPIAVRAGQHRCFDRFVVDLDGPATGYRVDYVPRLTQEGSGDQVPVTGGAILRVIVNAAAHDDAGRPTIDFKAVDRTSVAGHRTFRDVAWAGSFEGQTTMGLGVRARLPFRVLALSGPGAGSRLVIDVAHRW